jgi:hypothetical protein
MEKVKVMLEAGLVLLENQVVVDGPIIPQTEREELVKELEELVKELELV